MDSFRALLWVSWLWFPAWSWGACVLGLHRAPGCAVGSGACFVLSEQVSEEPQGFGCVALLLSYFRSTYFVKCLLSLWCSLLLARRRFQSISRFSLGTRYILFCMGTGSCKLYYLHATQVNCISCASCKVQLYSYCAGAAPRPGRWIKACSRLSLGGRCTLPGLCPWCPYLSSLHYLSA